MNKAQLVSSDRKHIWHPFTQMRDWQEEEFPVIEKGAGCYLIDVDGRRYLDGVSSLWCNVFGHRVPAIDKAVKRQLGKIAHTTFLGLSHPAAIELSEKLIAIAPKPSPGSGDRPLTRVFYSDSGSESVEIALKMAYQYWQQRGQPKKKKFVKLTNAYHGDTIGSVSVGGIDLFHQIYRPLLFETLEVPSPYRYRWPASDDAEQVKQESLEMMEKVLRENAEEVAALVMEPLMQGAAGMIDQPAGYISRARELTRKYNTLLIFDEVATGFGRTGKLFAAEHEGVIPDIMTVAKGLTGGYLPLAATLTTERVYEAFLGQYEDFKTFFHGHTYTANPLACAAALATLELFKKDRTIEKLQPKIALLRKRLQDFYKLDAVGDIRQAGTMIGIELVRDKRTRAEFAPKEKIGVRVIELARKKGAILRPLGPVIVLMPPLAMTEKELNRLLDIAYESIKEGTE
ncbi:MAG: L-Lysine-8-amino-7-oxononanoate aminotransferase [Candidatus Omnitrophica bacterium ADurb.Bin314]|nr:MAG: L-Lysine-8-amino-7-oxononanoate aminotransferase [Candidatus Omnitrophica bacterium ADurb.Bin314]